MNIWHSQSTDFQRHLFQMRGELKDELVCVSTCFMKLLGVHQVLMWML